MTYLVQVEKHGWIKVEANCARDAKQQVRETYNVSRDEILDWKSEGTKNEEESEEGEDMVVR